MRPIVLMVEDHPATQALVDASLATLDIELRIATTADDALGLAQSLSPDVILLDVNLAHVDGFEICRRIKSMMPPCPASILFLSGETSVEAKVRGLDLGASDFIVKPFHPAELQARVRVAMRTKFALDSLAQRAQIDGLTGLHNRAFFDRHLEAELAQARRHGSAFSCLMLDLDKFKSINDTHGHTVGDEVLRMTAATLLRRCRREDFVCRYGGEEFAILTPGVGINGAITLAEELRHLVSACDIQTADGDVHITCSVGVAELDATDPRALVTRADEALYYAKHMGRNRVSAEERFRHALPHVA